MKSKYIFAALASCFCSMFLSCTNEDAIELNSGALQVKTKIETRGVNVDNSFKENDKIGLFVVTPNGSLLTNANNAQATLNGSNWNMSNGAIHLNEDYSTVYSYFPYAVGNSLNKVDVDIAYKSKTGQFDYLYGVCHDYVNLKNTTAIIDYKYALSRITLSITKNKLNDNDSLSVDSVFLRNMPSSIAIASKGVMDVTTGTITKTSDYNAYVSTYVGKVISSDKAVSADILAIPTSVSDNVNLVLRINGNDISVMLPNITLEKGCQYTYPVEFTKTYGKTASLTIGQPVISTWTSQVGTTSNVSENNLNKPNLTLGGTIGSMVDLGLSVKWADHNLGGTNPQDYGQYVKWFSSYAADSLPHTICKTSYDIAHTQWGDNWRMPTYLEIKELIDNCSVSESTLNGVKGVVFTSKIAGYTDKYIFIPYAGYKYDDAYGTNSSQVGTDCDVWSGVLKNEFYTSYINYTGYQFDAGIYVLTSSKYGTYCGTISNKNYLPVRPVSE
jgi:hypothetical protein